MPLSTSSDRPLLTSKQLLATAASNPCPHGLRQRSPFSSLFVTTQTTQTVSRLISLITAINAYYGTSKTRIIGIERELIQLFFLLLFFFLAGADTVNIGPVRPG